MAIIIKALHKNILKLRQQRMEWIDEIDLIKCS